MSVLTNNRRNSLGFTLLEMLIAMTILAIVVMASIPSNKSKYVRPQVEESIRIGETYQQLVLEYYRQFNEFPMDNEAANLPPEHMISGNYLVSLRLADGALHLTFGNKAHEDISGQELSLRPIYVPGQHNTPISWICGNDYVPSGMLAAGVNLTSVDAQNLPPRCR